MDERILTTEEVADLHASGSGHMLMLKDSHEALRRAWANAEARAIHNKDLADSLRAESDSWRRTLEKVTAERDRLVQTVIEYLDNRPDDELGMKRQWDKFYPIARKLEQMLGVEDGRWG